MADQEYIRNASGMIVERIDADGAGNKTVYDFYGKMLGRYEKSSNVTRNFVGTIVAYGDAASALYWMQ